MLLQNKIAVVTGGSEGLGLSIVKKLLQEGCHVHIISRDAEKQAKSLRELNAPNLYAHAADVSDYKSIAEIADKIGEIDILINNAAIWLEGEVETNSYEEISKLIDVNTKGVIFTTKAFLPTLKKRDEAFILNISSTSGLKGRENQSVYVASKFAVTGFTDALKEDLASTNIKVAGFYPGGMNTALFSKAGFPKENQDWMDTDKVADIIVTMLKLDETMILDHVVLNKRKTKASN